MDIKIYKGGVDFFDLAFLAPGGGAGDLQGTFIAPFEFGLDNLDTGAQTVLSGANFDDQGNRADVFGSFTSSQAGVPLGEIAGLWSTVREFDLALDQFIAGNPAIGLERLLDDSSGPLTIDARRSVDGVDTRDLFGGAIRGRDDFGTSDRFLGSNFDDFYATDRNETIAKGRGGDDTLIGGDEDARLYGNAGNDDLRGGSGDDLLNGGSGDDSLKGRAGDDKLRGQGGDDRLAGGGGEDRLTGGSGGDLLRGGAGADRLNGGTGDDVLIAGRGDDVLKGGRGADLFVFAARGGEDRIADAERGHDMLLLDDRLLRGTSLNEIARTAEIRDGDAVIELRGLELTVEDASRADLRRMLAEADDFGF
ncbi:MAG: calcium-binding protein [Paracoccaceae bacterium]